jgi:hypothetical protein
MHAELVEFVRQARDKGLDHATIRMILLSSGWKERDIAEAVVGQSLGVAIPMPFDRGSARDTFNHLLSFVMLIAAATGMIWLLFTCIDNYFPDIANPERYDVYRWMSEVRWSMALLLVTFPIYLFMARQIAASFRREPERSWSLIRRWLTYLTLFVAAAILAGDGITLVYYLLEGDLTIAFLLKVIVLAAVVGLIFGYYLFGLRSSPADPKARRLNLSFQAAAIGMFVLSLALAAFVVGSPQAERLRRIDQRRIDDLREIAMTIRSIVKDDKQPIPKTLEEIASRSRGNMVDIRDPETGEPYRFEITGENTFNLCATFSAPRKSRNEVFWNHTAGEQCFLFDLALKEYPFW